MALGVGPMSAPEFAGPPPMPSRGPQRRGIWRDRIEALKARPGEWGRFEYPKGSFQATAKNLRDGRAIGVDPAEIECTSRTVDGKHYVYVRYIGASSPSLPTVGVVPFRPAASA